jgi:hypothetical protein
MEYKTSKMQITYCLVLTFIASFILPLLWNVVFINNNKMSLKSVGLVKKIDREVKTISA